MFASIRHFCLLASLSLPLLSFSFSDCTLSKTCKVWDLDDLSNGIHQGETVFLIYGDVNLHNRTLAFPSFTKIRFKGGSLKNGSIKGRFEITGIKKGSLAVSLAKESQICNRISVFADDPNTVASLLSACTEGASLKEDILISDAVELKGSLYGNGHVLRRTSEGNSTISIRENKNRIVLKDLTIIKDFEPGSINQSYAVYSVNSSNILFDHCKIVGRVYFVNRTLSDSPLSISENIAFYRCTLSCDLSKSPQGAQYGQDHITFCSIKNVSLLECEIISKNVNRVIKTSAYFPENVYEKAINCSDGIVFKKNKVHADCEYGKQFWDFFCGTVNVTIEDNDIDIIGFTEVFEDKSIQDKLKDGKLIKSTIYIINNRIRSKHSSLFQFCANSSSDCFVFQGNECHLYGSNKNPYSGFIRSSGSYLQGYSSCMIVDNYFYWEDEASGLMFATLNFDCLNTTIENNYFRDVYRVNMASARRGNQSRVRPVLHSFYYRNNVKEYTSSYRSPQIEVALEGVKANLVDIKINVNNTDDFYVSVNTDAEIDTLRFVSPGETEKAICILTDNVIINNLDLPRNYVKRGKNWFYQLHDAK